jgi:hypothetical protein
MTRASPAADAATPTNAANNSSRPKREGTPMKYLPLLALAPLLITPAEAYSRCQYFSDGREPRCLYKSDTGKEQYKRDTQRSDPLRPRGSWASRQTQAWRDNAKKRGAAAWQNNGTPSSVGTISPFVPGSIEDTAWRAERKRRGIQ